MDDIRIPIRDENILLAMHSDWAFEELRDGDVIEAQRKYANLAIEKSKEYGKYIKYIFVFPLKGGIGMEFYDDKAIEDLREKFKYRIADMKDVSASEAYRLMLYIYSILYYLVTNGIDKNKKGEVPIELMPMEVYIYNANTYRNKN